MCDKCKKVCQKYIILVASFFEENESTLHLFKKKQKGCKAKNLT